MQALFEKPEMNKAHMQVAGLHVMPYSYKRMFFYQTISIDMSFYSV